MNTENFDYFRTSDAMYIQRGTFSPEGTLLGLPIYLRDEKSDRVMAGLRFKKWTPGPENPLLLRSGIRRADLGGDVFEVPINHVLEIYKHRCQTVNGNNRDIIKKISSLLERNVSIMGSGLFNAETPDSDLDVLVYGKDAYHSFKSNIEKVRDSLSAAYSDPASIDKKVSSYCSRFPLDEAILKKILLRRNAKFFLPDGREMSLIFTYDVGEALLHPFEKITEWENVEVTDMIEDDSHSVMMPRHYIGEMFKVFSFRWLDRDFARKGEKVKIKGRKIFDDTILIAGDDDYILPVNLS